jgi:hypothetical protein
MLCMQYTYNTYVAYSIDHQAFVVYSIDNQTFAVYDMDQSKLRSSEYEPINRMLFTVWTHQSYVAYSMDQSILCCLV